MTDKLTKTFFDTFEIEPDIKSCHHRCKEDVNCKECNEAKVIYPQITDRILLELICIIGSIYICTQDKKDLKRHILVQCMNCSRDIKHQVSTLFRRINEKN